ncbi:hypothetical protein RhiirA4_453544 [Rhizophagus irregularis]|uniref:Uncharacterized protein n=1 Tax=Rhizophagus irregularis TaxID=588596 RepID=A0A2I1G0V6_9GLOM|nr:hypothetical protein RhiirA4_453544 [Rhizophagus irregularis]
MDITSYTPPYHCELQPIKGVWSTVKGTSSHPNLLAISDKLLYAFKKKITSKVIHIGVSTFLHRTIDSLDFHLIDGGFGTGYNCPVIETTKPAINEVIDPSITIKYTIPVKLSFDISNK